MSKERPLQSLAIVIRPCLTNFCLQTMKRRLLATIGSNRTALRATQSKLYSMFCVLFGDRIISRRAAVYTVALFVGCKDKCYADKPETIEALKDNIREAIAEIQLHIIDNVPKQPRQPFE